MEMYLVGVSVRRVEDITEALDDTRVSPSAVSELTDDLSTSEPGTIDRDAHMYTYLHGIAHKRR